MSRFMHSGNWRSAMTTGPFFVRLAGRQTSTPRFQPGGAAAAINSRRRTLPFVSLGKEF